MNTIAADVELVRANVENGVVELARQRAAARIWRPVRHGVGRAGRRDLGPAHGDGRNPLRALELDRDVAVFDAIAGALALERLERDALADARARAPAANSLARSATVCSNFEPGTTSSTRRHSTARLPLMPSSVVQKTSAWSRRTLRLSVTRVSPPVPGSTAEQRHFRQRHRRGAVVNQHDVVGASASS